jgi:hypothetical protein
MRCRCYAAAKRATLPACHILNSVPYVLYAERSNVAGAAGPAGASEIQGISGTVGAKGDRVTRKSR